MPKGADNRYNGLTEEALHKELLKTLNPLFKNGRTGQRAILDLIQLLNNRTYFNAYNEGYLDGYHAKLSDYKKKLVQIDGKSR